MSIIGEVCATCCRADQPTQHVCPSCRNRTHPLCGRPITTAEAAMDPAWNEEMVWCKRCDPLDEEHESDDDDSGGDGGKETRKKRRSYHMDPLNPLQATTIYVARHAWKEVALRIKQREPLVGEVVRLLNAGGAGKHLAAQVTKSHSRGPHAGTYRMDCPPAWKCRAVTATDIGSPAFLLVGEESEDAPFRQAQCGLLKAVSQDNNTATIAVAGGGGDFTGPVSNVRVQPVVYPYVERGQLDRSLLPFPREYSDWVIQRCGLLGGQAGVEELRARCKTMHDDLVRSSQLVPPARWSAGDGAFPLLLLPW